MPDAALIHAACDALPALRGKVWQPLSGGQTNRLWHVGEVVVKSYPPDRATFLFPNDPLAEAHALRLYHPLGLAPESLASGHDWIAYRYVTGAPWRSGVHQVAALLGRLHDQPVTNLPFRALPMGYDALLAQTRALCDLAGIAPELGTDDDAPPCTPCPLHGDAVAGNVIVTSSGPVMIDWQCPAIGDPAEDLAAFLSPAMQTIYRGEPLSASEERDFLAAYPHRLTVARYKSRARLYHARMLAHCLWRAKRGDAIYARAAQAEKARL